MTIHHTFRCLSIGLLLLLSLAVRAQTISGPTVPNIGVNTNYTYNDGIVYAGPNWTITNGTVISSSASGSVFSVTVQWTAGGAGTLTFKKKGGVTVSTLNVTVCGLVAYNVGGGGTMCPFGSGLSITLSNSQTGVNYQRYRDGVANGGTQAGTGSPLSITLVNNGTYTYVATETATGCTMNMNGSAAITYYTVPTAAVTPTSQAICSAQATGLSITNPNNVAGTTYTWTQSSSNVTGAANGSGSTIAQTLTNVDGINNGTVTYTITPSANGCAGTVVQVTITVKPNPVVNNLPAILEGCSPYGINFVPTSTLAGTTYTWAGSPGAGITLTGNTTGTGNVTNSTLTNSSSTVQGNATYAVTPTANGCTGTARILTVQIDPVPVVNVTGSPSLTYGSSTTLNASSAYSYQWKRNGAVLSGATQATYAVDLVGAYTVTTQVSSTSLACASAPMSVNTFLAAQPQPVNYVSTTRIYKKGLTTGSSLYTLQPSDLVQAVSYQDGLGRTFQTVAVGQSPGQFDMVNPVGYGKQGLVDTTFLPYVTTVKQGLFRLNAIRGSTGNYSNSEQKLFYQGTPQVAQDANPYARSLHRASLDARVNEQAAPGTDWQPNANQPSASHTVRSTLALNNATYTVRYWKADGTTTENYPNGTVRVAVTTDENGNQVRTYTNKQGQTVLKQVQLDDVINGSTVNWLETYYIYDAFGRLVYQVPPKAMAVLGTGPSLDANNTNVAELVYKYTYDVRGRLTQTKVPGAAVKYVVYDQLNRAVLTQDGNQRASNQWAYVKYDTYGRAVYSGMYTNTTQTTLAAVQGLFDTINYGTQPAYETTGSTLEGYTNLVFPTTGISVMAVNYYDDYDFDRNGTPDYTYDATHLTGLPATASSATRNLPTGSKKLVLGASTWLINAIFYDDLDRPVQTQSNNHLNALVQDKSSIKYTVNDLSSHVERTKQTHAGPTVLTVEQSYTYDHAWRTKAIYHSINGATPVQVAGYTYNALGQVVDKQLHVVGGTPLQSIDLRYNIRGWLKSINNAQLTNDGGTTNDDGTDLFGMELLYNTVETGLNDQAGDKLYYNGNLSASKWKLAGSGMALENTDGRSAYKYLYDKSDKLITAKYLAHDTVSAWNRQVGALTENFAYDHNGNLLSLQRRQNQRSMTVVNSLPVITSAPQLMDDLTYTYASQGTGTQNTNSMLKVEDAGTTGGFNNGTNVATEYTYSTDGSLTGDLNKSISAITYNILGKPQQITYANGTTVVYTYDAGGTKIKTATTESAVTTTTDYVGSFVYTNSALSFFSSPEGRVVKNGSSYEYQYAIADHQGNTRLIFSSVMPAPLSLTANFEGDANDNSNLFTNVNNVVPSGSANSTPGGNKVVAMNQAYATGPGKSLKVCPGDNVDVSVSTYFEGGNGYGSSNNSMATMVASIATAFGGVSGGTGESGLIYNGVNGALSVFGLGANLGDSRPSAYLNYILFDQQYRVVNMGWKAVPSSAYFNKQTITLSTVKVKEAGYMFVYLTYETASNNFVYFDDFKVTHTKNNVVQYNEYYAHGLQTANSWTRDNNTGNNFLFNGGTELNSTTSVYDLHYRGYDPQLGRMNQVDPVASKYASQTPYNYALNSPTVMNDPLGDDVYVSTALYNFVMNIFNKSGGNGGGSRSAGGSGAPIMDSGTAGGGRGSYGGTWDSENGYRPFRNGSEALAYGMAYNDLNNSWDNTQYGSRERTTFAYIWAVATGSMPSSQTVDYHLERSIENGNWSGTNVTMYGSIKYMKECACGPREGEYEYDVSRLNAIWQMVLDKAPFRSIESSFNIIRHLNDFTGVELSTGEILPYSLFGEQITTRQRRGATFVYYNDSWQEAKSLVILNKSGWSTIKDSYLGRTTDLGLEQLLEVYDRPRGTWYINDEKIGGDWVYGPTDWTRYHARIK